MGTTDTTLDSTPQMRFAIRTPRVGVAVRSALLIVLAIAAWRNINYVSGLEPGPDSSVFMSTAWHITHGHVLYKDVWGDKPPMIFVLDAVATAAGDGSVNSVRVMERFFAVAGVAAFFVVVYLAFGSFWLACLTSIFYLLLFYLLHVFEYGNVTEEYGAIFSIAAMAAVVASIRSSGRRSFVLCGIAGVGLSAAVLCKDPFMLMVPPWFLCVVWPREGNWNGAVRRTGAFLFGAAVPALIFIAYLMAHGAWSDWIGVIDYDFAYASRAAPPRTGIFLWPMLRMANFKVFHESHLALVAALLGLASLLHRPFVRRLHGLPLIFAASAALCLLATTLSGRYYGHYYLQFVPSYVLLGATGIAFAVHLVARDRRLIAAAVVVLLAILASDFTGLKGFAERLTAPAQRWQGNWLSDVVRRNTSPGDLIWAPWKPLLYSEAGRASPTKWHSSVDQVLIDTRKTSAVEQLDTLRNDLQRRPPRIIVVNAPPGAQVYHAQQFLESSGLASWIAANYWTAIGSSGDSVQVMVLHGAPATPRSAANDSATLAMKAGLKALYNEGDPLKAVFRFHRVLDEMPDSYGASFQLAKALDVAGQKKEARRAWARVYTFAQGSHDSTTVEVARRRLASADDDTPDAWMTAGLDCLYVLHDGPAATQYFRKVLTAVPGHYGATFQMAKSLDLEGKTAEARTQWQLVLRLAEQVGDIGTAGTARARLQQLR